MRKIIFILCFILLTSCGMTNNQLQRKNEECLRMGMRAERTFNGEGFCTTKGVIILHNNNLGTNN